jgi:glycosyltransferase involved in cell wall biosynthesis
MRLLQVLPSIDPGIGGTAEAVRQLGMQLVRIGSRVDLATVDNPTDTYIRQYPLNVIALGPAITNYRYSSKLVPWLQANVGNYDAVIINGLWQFPSFAVWRVLRRRSIPYYVFPHGMLDPWFKRTYPLKHAKKWLYWPWADYRVLRDARRVLFTCEEEQRLARRSFWLYLAREQVVGLGIGPPPTNGDELKERFLRANPALRSCRVLLFMGRLHEKKGCDLLIEAFAKVASVHPDAHLVIAGAGSADMLPQLQDHARRLGLMQRISWPGMLLGDMKWGAMYCAEAFVLPSHQENFGIAVAEALSCGVPVLISDKVNIWREIEADGAGLVAPDSREGTERNLRTWLDLDFQQRAAMRGRAAMCFQHRFAVTAAAAALLRAIQQSM